MDVRTGPPTAGGAPAGNVRALLLTVGTVLGAGAALRHALPHLARLYTSDRIDDLVAGALIGIGAMLAGWYLITALLGLLCLAARGTGAVWRRGEAALSRAGAPLLRRALGAGAGAALMTGSLLGPAYSAPADEGEVPVDLTWAGEHTGQDQRGDPGDGQAGEPDIAPTAGEHASASAQDQAGTPGNDVRDQDEPAPDPGSVPGEHTDGPGSTETGTTAPGTDTTAGDDPSGHPRDETAGAETDSSSSQSPADEPGQTGAEVSSDQHTSGEGQQHGSDADGQDQSYTVRPGDSLWRIAAAHLPADASLAEIAEQWPRWYQANTDTIGSDPELIHPGQALDHPERSTR